MTREPTLVNQVSREASWTALSPPTSVRLPDSTFDVLSIWAQMVLRVLQRIGLGERE